MLYNFPLTRSQASLFVSRTTSCINLFYCLRTPQLHQHHHLNSTCHPEYPLYTRLQGVGCYQTSIVINIHTCPIHTRWLICAASMHKRLAHFNHATLHTTTLVMQPFPSLYTVVSTNTSTTNTTWPSARNILDCIHQWLGSANVHNLTLNQRYCAAVCSSFIMSK